MINLNPINQTKLFCLDKYISKLIRLFDIGKFPNKLLLTGQKGIGKSTLAYHLVNYILSLDEEFCYNKINFQINLKNHSYKTILNKSNPNLLVLDILIDKKTIDISQVRELIMKLNKSSFNTKPRFVLIDNIEFLNKNSINALLKVIEEPNFNIHFILINNNNKKILPTLISRCINYKIFLTNEESLKVANFLLEDQLENKISSDLINYYSTPGNIFNLVLFGDLNKFNLKDLNLKQFLKIIIKENYYKKDTLIKPMIFDLIEFYFRKINYSFSSNINKKYSNFLKRISDTKKFNLDEESLFIDFDEEILNG
jgi:DNA polymerase III subunit delta'